MTKIFILFISFQAFTVYSYVNFVEGKKPVLNKPNVLLLVVDDLRPTINAFGDSFAVTPNIDKIARNGVIFSKAFAQQALCGPSRTSFLTSRRPDTTRSIDVHYYWRNHSGNYTTLPQYFKENGYFTQSVGKIFHPGISSNYNDDQPYSWSAKPYHPSTQKFKNSPVCKSSDRKLHSNIYCPVKVSEQPEKTLPDIQSTNFALNWLRKRAEKSRNWYKGECKANLNQPFFLAVGFHKPHIPLKFPMEFLDLYPIEKVPLAPNRFRPRGLPLVAWNPWNDLRRRDDIGSLNLSFPFGPMPDSYSKYIKQGYYAATSYTDSLIGLIVAQTKQLFPNTIIVLMGDHGWSLGEHQEWSKFSNYDVSTKVPLVISLPEQRINSKNNLVALKGLRRSVSSSYFKKFVQKFKKKLNISRNFTNYNQKRYDGVIELLDVFPTLVDLAGLEALPKCPSHSFNISICTEGESLSCLVNKIINDSHRRQLSKDFNCSLKIAAFSQFPRPGVYPSVNPDSDQPRLTETKIMGYSVRTNRFRYTSWLKFNHSTFDVDFAKVYGEELYDHKFDDEENANLFPFRKHHHLVRMRKLLKTRFQS